MYSDITDEVISSHIETIFQNESIDGEIEDNFNLIIKYYHILNEREKEIFNDIILNCSIEDAISFSPFKIMGRGLLCIKVMIYLGGIKRFIDKQKDNNYFYGLIQGYKEILSNLNDDEASIYGQKLIGILINLDTDQIEVYYQKEFNYNIRQIVEEIVQRKLGNIRIKVNQVDIEIESDQGKVIELIEEFGFNPEFNKFLTQLKSRNISEEDEIQFAGTIATFREFFGNIIISIGDKMAEFNNEKMPEYGGEDGKIITSKITIARKYIKEKGNLSDKENKFINDYIEILHKEGGHNMFSSQQYFRLTKNIGIEMLYMLLSKTKEFA